MAAALLNCRYCHVIHLRMQSHGRPRFSSRIDLSTTPRPVAAAGKAPLLIWPMFGVWRLCGRSWTTSYTLRQRHAPSDMCPAIARHAISVLQSAASLLDGATTQKLQAYKSATCCHAKPSKQLANKPARPAPRFRGAVSNHVIWCHGRPSQPVRLITVMPVRH